MKNELTTMGPAFIKMGQFLSTRQDIFGKEVIQELSTLQDSIPQTPFEDIKCVIETSLDQPLEDVFSEFSEVAIASASIGQVHTARLKSNGKRVAVKIQKPNVATFIQDDLRTLKQLNAILKMFNASTFGETERLLEQYEKYLSAELDYGKEIDFMRRFKKNLDSQPVVIPGVYVKLSTKEILVMEYVPSVKITNLARLQENGIDTAYLARTLVECFIFQMTTTGYIHCDPHPGNLGVTADGATLVLYDFGNVVQFSDEFRKSISQIIFAIFQKDIDEFVELLVRLKVIEVTNADDVYEIKEFFTYFFGYLESLDAAKLKESIANGDISDSFRENLKINPDFMALFRIFSLLDGTCSLLDKDFNYFDALQPFSQGMMNDVSFIDSRARKDIDKLRTYPSLIKTTDRNIARLQKNVTSVTTKLQQTQILALCLCLFHDHIELFPFVLGIAFTAHTFVEKRSNTGVKK